MGPTLEQLIEKGKQIRVRIHSVSLCLRRAREDP
jgi:hypothetical protein